MPKRIVHRLGFRYSNSTGPRYQQEISTHLSAAAVHGDTIETLRHLGAAAESLEQVGDPRLAETCEKKIQLANKLIGKGEKVDLEDLIKTHALRTNALRDMHAKADGTMHGDANVVIDACEKYLSCARRYKDKIHEIEALILKGACCIDCFNGRKKNKQHLDAAYASLEKALHLNQSNAPLSKREVNKHSILLQKSRISSALNDTSKSERLIKQAEACLILAKNSNAIPNREYYELSATCYGMTSDIYVSKKEYKRALELAEQNVANLRKLTIPSSHLPSALISLGEIYFALSRENESLIAYKEALKSGLLTIDDQDEVYNMIKQIEYIRGKRMELRALDEKLGRNMKKNECKDLLAEAYNICEAICDFTKGLVYLMRLLSLATNGEPSELANLYADIGMCHAEGNNIAEAIKWYEKGTRTYIEKTTNYFNCKIAQYGQYVIQGIKNYRSLRIMLMEISEEAVDVGNWQIRKNTLETMLLLDRNNQHQDNCNNTKAMIRTTESKIMENSRVLKPPESSSEDEGALRYHNRETAKATAKLKPSSSTAKYDFIASNSPLKLISPGRRKERMIVGLSDSECDPAPKLNNTDQESDVADISDNEGFIQPKKLNRRICAMESSQTESFVTEQPPKRRGLIIQESSSQIDDVETVAGNHIIALTSELDVDLIIADQIISLHDELDLPRMAKGPLPEGLFNPRMHGSPMPANTPKFPPKEISPIAFRVNSSPMINENEYGPCNTPKLPRTWILEKSKRRKLKGIQ